MIAHSKNRVQAIKSKFENLSNDNEPLLTRKPCDQQLCKQSLSLDSDKYAKKFDNNTQDIQNDASKVSKMENAELTGDDITVKPNSSYLYSQINSPSSNEAKKTLTRQVSDPCKKLQRSHAFRCDKTKVILQSPKRHGSCKGRPSDTNQLSPQTSTKKLSVDKLKQLGNILDKQMQKENFVPSENNIDTVKDSIPDEEVPKHILEQYAKVLKPRKRAESPPEKQEFMTDSGVSSETENVDDEKVKIKKMVAQFEGESSHQLHMNKIRSNLEVMDSELCGSTETVKLERKNPHLVLTDTLKKALKQPLPIGPPPKKPPRTFTDPIPESPEKKDAKKMLEKLEQVLHKRETQNQEKNIYDIAETNLSQTQVRPKEIHYLCTEILDITQRTLLPNQTPSTDVLKNCFNSLNCAITTTKSTTSLPYSRFSTGSAIDRKSVLCCSCSSESLDVNRRLSTFFKDTNDSVCSKCKSNESKNGNFKCHLLCKCNGGTDAKKLDDHIYDVPFNDKSVHVYKSDQSAVRKCNGGYGMLNGLSRMYSKSMEDLKAKEEEKIYDIPCEDSRPPTPEPLMSEFQKLKLNFETGFVKPAHNNTVPKLKLRRTLDASGERPILKPKPVLVKIPSDTRILSNMSKSTDNVTDFDKTAKQVSKSYATEFRRKTADKNENQGCLSIHGIGLGLPKWDKRDQMDVDKENLTRLMNEIYDTVTAACEMEDQTPGKFPTTSCDNSSEDSVKLTRSLTEKRKNYVRRVSSRAAYLDRNAQKRYRNQTSVCSYKSDILPDSQYPTFRSWKSFKNSQSNLNGLKMASDFTDSKFNLTDSSGNLLTHEFDSSIDDVTEKAGCLDIDLPFVPKERGLFDVCLLVDYNYMAGRAYVKSIFPCQVKIPPHIEDLIFPQAVDAEDNKLNYESAPNRTQSYSFVLTDEKGERRYGYCRRVLPEGAACCLPLCYCLIARFRAPGFYYKVLKEIEANHGSTEYESNTILQQLFESEFPNPGQEITISYESTVHQELVKNTSYRKSINLGEVLKSKTLPNKKVTSLNRKLANDLEFYDYENNNHFRDDGRPRSVFLSVESERKKCIKMPIEPRVDEDSLTVLLDTLGASLLIKLFGSLLLERKVIVVADNLSQLSSCIEGLQSILYPFVWQQPLISVIPSELKSEILEAPVPILAGLLMKNAAWEQVTFEEGILVDITDTPKVEFYQGDECTILPTNCYKALKTTLQLESHKNQNRCEDNKTRNVLISEAFLRFFADILHGFDGHFTIDTDKGTGFDGVNFDKTQFIKNAKSKQNQYFLEWFTETTMFNHFLSNMATVHKFKSKMAPQQQLDYAAITNLVDVPLPVYYELFMDRVSSNSKTKEQKIPQDSGKNNYKNAMNKKVKLLKNKLRDLIT